MTIFETLREDHHRLRLLLENLIEATSHSIEPRKVEPSQDAARDRLDELELHLLAHTKAEEAVVYDRLRAIPHRAELADQAEDEHHEVEIIVAKLRSMDVDDEAWDETVSLLKNQLELHLADEESNLFAILEMAIENDEAERLALDFEHERTEAFGGQALKMKTAPPVETPSIGTRGSR